MNRINKIIIAILLIFVTSCGTILKYDNRNEPKTSEIDYGVVFLDALGLFVFVVPGVIAFIVDFSTEAIYLSESAAEKKEDDFKQELVTKLIIK